jgi:hypothetical protein
VKGDPVVTQRHQLVSQPIQLADDLAAINAYFYQQQWTDGLPIIPPTPERVEVMIDALDRDPQEEIGVVPPYWAPATVEKVAINAVMAGCLPEYLPVVVAAVEAVTEPTFNLYGIQATTNPVAPLLIVNGPIASRLDINGGPNAFGQGWRANATIGRALRLVLINIGGGRPGTTDKATHGMPAKFSFCIAENEEHNPWQPLHVERGFPPEASTVTAVSGASLVNILDLASQNAQGVLTMLATSGRFSGSNNTLVGGGPLYALSPEHAEMIAAEGFSKDDVKRYLWENAVIRLGDVPPEVQEQIRHARKVYYGDATQDTLISLGDRPEDFLVIVTGGPGPHSMLITTFGDSQVVTREIRA